MPADDEMTLAERRKYLRLLQPRYRRACRGVRGKLLDEMQKVTRLGTAPLLVPA